MTDRIPSILGPLGNARAMVDAWSGLQSNTAAAIMKAALPLHGATDAMQKLVEQGKLLESATRPLISPFLGLKGILSERQDFTRRTLGGIFGPGSVMQEFAKAAQFTDEQYSSLFGPSGSLAKALGHNHFAFGHLTSVLNGLDRRNTSVRGTIAQLNAFGLNLGRDLLDSPLMRSVQEATRTLGESHGALSFKSSLMSGPFHGLNLVGFQELTDQLRKRLDDIEREHAETEDESEFDMTAEEQQAVRDMGAAALKLVGRRFDSMEERVALLNANIESLNGLMRAPNRARIRNFILMTLWTIILSVFSNYVTDYLKQAMPTAGEEAPSSNRPVDVVRESRRRISELELPSEVVRVLRVVRRHSAPVHRVEDVDSTLRLGQMVEVVGAVKNWRQIRWIDSESDTIAEGWIRAKYLKKLTR